MRINLPMDLLRSFVTIVDTGSMARASEHVFLTQSALSLQMKRLADIIQQPIFRRQQGTTTLTPAGELLLSCAREILALNDRMIATVGGRLAGPARIGMVQDFADAILSGVLARFRRLNPDIRMEIRVGNSAELEEQIGAGLLDIALYIGDANDKASVATAEMTWLGDIDLLTHPTLPIAIMTKPCLFREAGINALEAMGRPYSIALETPSISVLRAAVESGLAITCRTTAFMQHASPVDIGAPPLPKVSFNLATRDDPHPAIESLTELIRSALAKP